MVVEYTIKKHKSIYFSFASVLAQTGKLLRAELPHIHEVEGVKDLPYLKEIYGEIAHRLDVEKSLVDYLAGNNGLHEDLVSTLDSTVANDIEDSKINLRNVSVYHLSYL